MARCGPQRSAPARAGHLVRALGFVMVAGGLYAGSVTAALGPDNGPVAGLEPLVPAPSLMRAGSDVLLSGSVDHIFESAAFVGPNRAEKRNRPRPNPTGIEVAGGFEVAYVELAAQRIPDDPPPLSVAEIEAREKQGEASVRIASLDHASSSEALSAIAGLTGGDRLVAPRPADLPEQLAYARANAPVTVFAESKWSAKERECLATAIYFEARGESYRGQVAVAQVVVNRTKHKLYPDTLCTVVFQNQHMRNACQFSFACDGIPEVINEKKAWAQAEEIADQVAAGTLYLPEVGNATHYHANYVRPHWAPRLNKLTQIGQHIFYRFKGTYAANLS